MDIESLRAIERIIIVMFAGTSIILGWHLFKIGVVSPQSGTFVGKGFKFSLQKVGPGIFFSLFGTVVLSTALIYGLNKQTDFGQGVNYSQASNSPKVKRTNVSYNNGLQSSALKRLTEAINTLKLISIEESNSFGTHRKAIKKSIQRLNAYRDSLSLGKFTPAELEAYRVCSKSNDQTCKQDSSYKEVNKWFTDNLLQS